MRSVADRNQGTSTGQGTGVPGGVSAASTVARISPGARSAATSPRCTAPDAAWMTPWMVITCQSIGMSVRKQPSRRPRRSSRWARCTGFSCASLKSELRECGLRGDHQAAVPVRDVPAGLEQPAERGARVAGEVDRLEHRVAGRHSPLDHLGDERAAGLEVAVESDPADTCRGGDVVDARIRVAGQAFGGRVEDRGDVLAGVGPLRSGLGARRGGGHENKLYTSVRVVVRYLVHHCTSYSEDS